MVTGEAVNFETVEKIANAVLYEGYMLYPYRPSSTKNRQRWNFGTLYPQRFAEVQRPAEAFSLRAECMAQTGYKAKLSIRVRFLHLDAGESPQHAEADGWIEGIERDTGAECSIRELLDEPHLVNFVIGSLVGNLRIHAGPIEPDMAKFSIELANLTPINCATRDEALPYAFTSAHLLLGIEGGQFVSLLDPPAQYEAAVAQCHNARVYPVLVGDVGRRDKLLCSPIILYDYPQVAPESAGDFFDGTEMDEMLSLRVLTMTDEEKAEMKAADARSRRLLERTEMLPAEHMMKLHGAIRGLRRVQQRDEGE